MIQMMRMFFFNEPTYSCSVETKIEYMKSTQKYLIAANWNTSIEPTITENTWFCIKSCVKNPIPIGFFFNAPPKYTIICHNRTKSCIGKSPKSSLQCLATTHKNEINDFAHRDVFLSACVYQKCYIGINEDKFKTLKKFRLDFL